MAQTQKNRLIVGITGASGTVYGVRLLEALKVAGIETHLVMSDAAKLTMAAETDYTVAMVESLASVVHAPKNIGAAIASGSLPTLGMVVAPCSVHTMSDIAWGSTSNLITRAADVVLKERRKLILVARETPYNLIHIKNMETITLAGGIICPATPSFYSKPKTMEELAMTVVNRMLDLAGIDHKIYRWGNAQ